MMDATLRIKNLSIALEAVSRVVNCTTAFLNIENLLLDEIQKFQKEKEKENQWPQRPARTATTNLDYDPYKKD